MLRITTNENPQVLVLLLEGRLEGPWVSVLADCWSRAVRQLYGRKICVDLNGVTFVDAAGKARLAELYQQGAELVGEDLETKAIVAEIRTGGASDGNGKAIQKRNHKSVASLGEQLTNLERLRAELHEVNEELARAARPLDRISDLNEQQRQHVADQLRAGLARWESVTQRISKVLSVDGANDKQAEAREGGSR
jgi:ABC-type transporter Mla MlaB component